MYYSNIETKRLLLIPVKDFKIEENPEIINQLTNLLNNEEIYRLTLNIPFPYTQADAIKFISEASQKYEAAKIRHYGIFTKDNFCLIGGVAISYNSSNFNGEIAYWIGKEYWNNGYCSEVVSEMIAQGFENWGYNKIYARHFVFNKSSERVMQKNGMTFEGILREENFKNGCFYDISVYSILKSEFRNDEKKATK